MPTAGLIPRRKDLLGYARALERCTTRAQLDIVSESYRAHVAEKPQREVLDILANALIDALNAPPALPASSNGPDVAALKAQMADQLLGLRVMRAAAEKSGFTLRVQALEIEIRR